MRRLSELYAGPRKGWPAAGKTACSGSEDGTERIASAATLTCSDRDAEGGEHEFVIPGFRDHRGKMLRVNILAMGDVGGTLALAMKLTGADIVSSIGICDISERTLQRWEQELNQIAVPADVQALPPVEPVGMPDLFDCDVFVFCASRGVPEVARPGGPKIKESPRTSDGIGTDAARTDGDGRPGDGAEIGKGPRIDVRMVQLEKNLEMVRSYAADAVKAGYDGEFFIVSDPVDPLCKGAVSAGLRPQRVQGFGLGVMNGRAAYHAQLAVKGQQANMAKYLTEGRVYGPHGEDLVVANSILDYDEEASLELTRLTVEANLRIRDLGYKPYIAPAVTSGALSILENLRGNWQYSSAWFGACAEPNRTIDGAFLGMRNRRCEDGLLVEDPPLDEKLFARIERAYRNLEKTPACHR